MKTYKLLIYSYLLLVATSSFGQNETDALRLSQYYTGGTARGVSMGGSFGALGGDMTSLSITPAGIGVYRSSEFTFTPTVTADNSKSTFLGGNYTDSKYSFNLNNIGYVFTYNSQQNKGLVSLSFGLGYNRLVDFNKNVTIHSNAATSSLLNSFTSFANNNISSTLSGDDQIAYLKNNYPVQALAYNTDAIFYDDTYNSFSSDFDSLGYGQHMNRMITTKGGIGEYVFSMGGNISNILYLGATFGVQHVYYEEITNHDEYDININAANRYIKDFSFTDNFNISGTGLNFKMGAILKPVDFLRLGLAWHSPTFYTLTSEAYNTMNTSFYNESPLADRTDITSYDYKVRTPSKVIASVALKLQQFALINMDYEFVDYTKMNMRADDYSFNIENSNIKDNFRATTNVKLGAELKLGDFALRGGYGFYGSPYKSGDALATTSYSGGFGYHGGNFFIDMGYIVMQTKYTQMLYSYTDSNNNDVDVTSKINSNSGRYMMTIGFKF